MIRFPESSDELPDDWRQALTYDGWWRGINENEPMWSLARERPVRRTLDRYEMHVVWDYCTTGPQIHNVAWSEDACRERIARPMKPALGERILGRRKLPPLNIALAEALAHILHTPCTGYEIDRIDRLISEDGPGPALAAVYSLSIRIAIRSYDVSRMRRQASVLPYVRFLPSPQYPCASEACRFLDGKIVPILPFLSSVYVFPNDFDCHCGLEQVSASRIVRRGWRTYSADEITKAPQPRIGYDRSWGDLYPSDYRPPLLDMGQYQCSE